MRLSRHFKVEKISTKPSTEYPTITKMVLVGKRPSLFVILEEVGSADDFKVYENNSDIIVVSFNEKLNYAGIVVVQILYDKRRDIKFHYQTRIKHEGYYDSSFFEQHPEIKTHKQLAEFVESAGFN